MEDGDNKNKDEETNPLLPSQPPDPQVPLQHHHTHATVQYASIFVWSIEGLVLCLIWWSYSLALRSVFSSSSSTATVASLDMACSSCLLVTYVATIGMHWWAASYHLLGLHTAASTAQRGVVALAFLTYLSTYLDACVAEVPNREVCSLLLFHSVPVPIIMGAVISGLVLVLLFTATILAFISPTEEKSGMAPFLIVASSFLLHGYWFVVSGKTLDAILFGLHVAAALLLVAVFPRGRIHSLISGVLAVLFMIQVVVQLFQIHARVAALLLVLAMGILLLGRAILLVLFFKEEEEKRTTGKEGKDQKGKYVAASFRYGRGGHRVNGSQKSDINDEKRTTEIGIFETEDVRSSLTLRHRYLSHPETWVV